MTRRSPIIYGLRSPVVGACTVRRSAIYVRVWTGCECAPAGQDWQDVALQPRLVLFHGTWVTIARVISARSRRTATRHRAGGHRGRETIGFNPDKPLDQAIRDLAPRRSRSARSPFPGCVWHRCRSGPASSGAAVPQVPTSVSVAGPGVRMALEIDTSQWKGCYGGARRCRLGGDGARQGRWAAGQARAGGDLADASLELAIAVAGHVLVGDAPGGGPAGERSARAGPPDRRPGPGSDQLARRGPGRR